MTGAEDFWVAGVDACRSGWVCAVVRIVGGKPAHGDLRFEADFAGILAVTPSPAVIAVDMPIGLPEHTGAGGRPPERCVRPILGARQSSVFSIPARSAVFAASYPEACEIALETSDPPRKVSKQAFNIFPRIREIDAIMTPQLQCRVFESHPEVVFAEVSGAPAPFPKKIKSRVNREGIDWRIEFLVRQGIPKSLFEDKLPPDVRHARDDIADAAACALSAWRIWRGDAVRYPGEPVFDACGLDMAIWA